MSARPRCPFSSGLPLSPWMTTSAPAWWETQGRGGVAGRKHICQLAKAGRGWPRLEAALRVFWRRRGVLEGELADASGGLPFHIAPLAFEVLRVGRLGLGVGRRAEDVVQEVARHLRVLEQDVRVVDRHLGERYLREIERTPQNAKAWN